MEALSEGEDSTGGHWKSRSKRQKSSFEEEDLSQPWAAAKTERWAMPTWCHIFNSTLTENARVWFDDLSQESIDSYDDLKKAFLENYLLQKKCIKDPVEIHNINQRDRQSTEEFVRSKKLDRSKTLRREAFETNEGQRESRTEKRNASKFYEFNREVGHTTDECMHLKRTIKEMLKAGNLSHLIKELKQSNVKDQVKAAKKGKLRKRQAPGNPDDKGSSSEILYEHCFNRFHLEVKSQMVPATTPLVGFSGEIIWPLGQISLFVKIGNEENLTSAWMNFMVVRSPSPYNRIIGKQVVRRIQEVRSTAYEMLKFLVIGETVTLRSRRIIPLECTMVSGPRVPQPIINQVTEEKIQVAIHPEYLEQTIAIGSTLTEEGRKELYGLLRRNLDIFAWKLAYMFGVPHHIAEHKLNIREGCLPVRKKKMGQAHERNKATYEEAEMAFKQMEKLIAELPMLTAAEEKEELIIYLAAAKEAISAVLMTERDGKQMPIYFVSRVLQGPEINCTLMEKLILALMLSNMDVTGMLFKWRFELEEHDIHYRSRKSVKRQILADFIVERSKDDPPDTPMKYEEELPDPWILFTDGSSCIDGSGAGLIITNPEGMEFTYALRFRFEATNNEA
nr:reverse transcriptase domain-containing protein [Tanacetum cinerariifolium]